MFKVNNKDTRTTPMDILTNANAVPPKTIRLTQHASNKEKVK